MRTRASTTAAILILPALLAAAAPNRPAAPEGAWRDDPAWHQGKAEWARYAATRRLYGVERRYDATIFTNVQHMDPFRRVKVDDPAAPGAVAVFKHNVSEIVPTEHYDYRFLTTTFLRADDLAPFALSMSSQEDCGTSFKRFDVVERGVRAETFTYFPGGGRRNDGYVAPEGLAFHDGLTLRLRDYPFERAEAGEATELRLALLPDQTDTRATPIRPEPAIVRYAGRERIAVPRGTYEAWRLELEDGRGEAMGRYWFSAEPGMRRVLLRYEDPAGMTLALERFGWWAYWDRAEAAPE